MAGLTNVTLSTVAGRMPIRNDQTLIELLTEADSLPGAVFGVVDFSRQSVAYVGNTIEEWTGIAADEFITGGIRKIVTIVKPTQIPHLALTHAAFVHQARARDFDPRSVQYLDFGWTAVGRKGALPLLSTAVVLSYTPARDLEWAVIFEIKDSDGALGLLASCKRLLRLIKERHNQIYLHPATPVNRPPGPIQFTNPVVGKITEREMDVLRLLAQGFSTQEVAAQLNIAVNTVETHRRKLLEKFGARNVAELIWKASKVYWLE